MPRFPASDVPEAREALLRTLARLADKLGQSHGPHLTYGHNQPPLDLGLAKPEDVEIVLLETGRVAGQLAAEIEASAPDRGEVAAKLSRLQKLRNWLADKGEVGATAATKAMGTAIGAAIGLMIVSPGTLETINSVLRAGLRFLLGSP